MVCIVGFGKHAPAHQLRLERCQILRAHVALQHLIVLAVERLAGNSYPVGVAIALQAEDRW
jgi:hypothetical protein